MDHHPGQDPVVSSRLMRGTWLLITGVALLLGIGAGALSLRRHAPTLAAAGKRAESQPDASGLSEISIPGKIEAQHVVPVPVPVGGVLESFLVETGQEVYQGQLLARIRNDGLEQTREAAAAEVDRIDARVSNLESSIVAARLEATRGRSDASDAKSAYARAEKNFLRQQMLNREGATPRLAYEKGQKEFETTKADFETLDIVARQAEDRVSELIKNLDAARRLLQTKTQDLEGAKADLASSEVYSPVDGIVVRRRGVEGDEVTPDIRDLFQIGVELSELEAVVEPTPPMLLRIKPGQSALLQVAEVPGNGVLGKVREVRGTQVVVEFSNPNPAIKPGLTAQVRIKLG